MEQSEAPQEHRVPHEKELSKGLVDMLGKYYHVLVQDGEHFEKADLGEQATNELDRHLEQLEELQDLLEEYFENPASFDIRGQKIDKDTGTYSVKLKRKEDESFGEGPENSQTQLSFLFQENPILETDRQIIEAVGRRGGDLDQTLSIVDRERKRDRLHINTVKLFRDANSGRTTLIPQAGIVVSRRGKEIISAGVKYVGTHPHQLEIPTPTQFGHSHIDALRTTVLNLATERH